MKNKKSIYVLLPLVLLIWGTVVYEFFSYSNQEEINSPSNAYSGKQFQIKKKDTFSIKINPRDPFLGKMVYDGMAQRVKNKTSGAKTIVKKEALIWPQIKYKGIVADNKDKVKVYMLIIDGKIHLMKKGEEVEDVFLKDGDRETVYVKYKGDIKVVFIQ